jgi:hypothetical protein
METETETRTEENRSLLVSIQHLLLKDKEPFCLEFAMALIHFINYSIIVMPFSLCAAYVTHFDLGEYKFSFHRTKKRNKPEI